jgi:hypothetical protein
MAGLNLITARIVHWNAVCLDWPYSGCALTERWILTISWLTPSRSVGSTSARPAIASARKPTPVRPLQPPCEIRTTFLLQRLGIRF